MVELIFSPLPKMLPGLSGTRIVIVLDTVTDVVGSNMTDWPFMAACRRACNWACVVGLAKPELRLPEFSGELAGVCANEIAVMVARNKTIESFAMFKRD